MLSDSHQASLPNAFVNDRHSVAAAYTFVLISLPLSAILLPVLVLIFFLSDATIRRTWIFLLSAIVLVLGIVQGALSTLVESLVILYPQYQIPDWLYLTFIGVVLYTSIVVDCVLILRLSAVYPAVLIRPRTRFTLLLVPASCTAARIACVTIVLHRWTVLAAQSSASEASRLVWPRNSFIVADCAIQLLENTYCSVLFIARLSTRKVLSSRMYREQSFAKVLRGLIYIAVGNFVFPTMLSGIQLAFVVHGPSIYNGAAVLLVNNFVSILGAVFSTIWSTSDVWKSKRRQAQAMDMYGSQLTCDTLTQHSHYSIRQSAISLSGIAPNLTPLPAPERASFASRLSLSSLSLSMRSAAGKSLSYSKRSSMSSAGLGTGAAGRRFTMIAGEGGTVSRVGSGSGKLSKTKRRKRERERERERGRELERVRRTLTLEKEKEEEEKEKEKEGEKALLENDPAYERSTDSHTPILRQKGHIEEDEDRLEEVVLETPKWTSRQAGLVPPSHTTQQLPSNPSYPSPSISQIPSSRFLKASSSIPSLHTQHTMDTDTDFDFGSPTPPPQLFQSHSSFRPRTNSHSASIAFSLASSSAYTSTNTAQTGSSDRAMRDDLATGQVTVIDFREMENRTPEPAVRGRGREEDVRWGEPGREMFSFGNEKARNFFVGGGEASGEGRRPSEATVKITAGGSTPTGLGTLTSTGTGTNGMSISPSAGNGSALSRLTSFGFGRSKDGEKERKRDLEAGVSGIVPWQ